MYSVLPVTNDSPYSNRNVYTDGSHMLAGDGALANGSCFPNVSLDPIYALHDQEFHTSDGEPYCVRSYISLLRPTRYLYFTYLTSVTSTARSAFMKRLC